MPSIMSVLGTAGRSLREGVFEPRILQQAQQRTDLKKKEQRQTEADFIIEAREAWLALDQEMLNNVLEKYKRAVPTQTFRTIAENITEAINVVKKERANKAAEKADELRVPFPQTPEGELDVESVATVSDPAFQFLKARLGRPYSYTDEGGKTITIPGMDPKEADTEIQKAYKASPQMLPISDAVQYDAVQASRDAIGGRQQQANPISVKRFVAAIRRTPSKSIFILNSNFISQKTRDSILNELSRLRFNWKDAFEAHEDAKKQGVLIKVGDREIDLDTYQKLFNIGLRSAKAQKGKRPFSEPPISWEEIEDEILSFLSGTRKPVNVNTPPTGGASGVDTLTTADTVSAVPDTLGADTLTAGGTPAAPPPTTQQGSETFRYTDSVLAQKIIDALYSLKLQIEDNAGQSTPQQEAAVEFLKTKLDSLRIP